MELDKKLVKVQYINNKNIDKAHRCFTGSITVHWSNGEPMKEEEVQKREIKIEK